MMSGSRNAELPMVFGIGRQRPPVRRVGSMPGGPLRRHRPRLRRWEHAVMAGIGSWAGVFRGRGRPARPPSQIHRAAAFFRNPPTIAGIHP
jgi:hypothetical protein